MPERIDSDLADRIRRAMLVDERLSQQPVDVSVDAGVVRLEGTVSNHRRELAAVEIASSFVGCLRVDNALTVDPVAPLPDDTVADHARAALAAHPEIAKSTISVAVTGGHVTLRGSVASEWEKLQAEDAALAATGVRSVDNLLAVDLPGQFIDREMHGEIKQSLAEELGPDARAIRVAVASDTVILSGHAPLPWHGERAEAIARESGVVHVRNEILFDSRAAPAPGR